MDHRRANDAIVGMKGARISMGNEQLQLLMASNLFVFVRLSETAPKVTNWLCRFSMSSDVPRS
jgi:hypothetical protein